MVKDVSGLIDLVKSGAMVAVHIGFGRDRFVKSGQIRSYEFDTTTLTLQCSDGIFVIPLSSVSTIKVLEPMSCVHLVKG